ncbi:hypothetical protein L9F63_014046, partial [Diploptera punctata]
MKQQYIMTPCPSFPRLLRRHTSVASSAEWTPVDGLLCAIVQRRNDGLIPDCLTTSPTWGFEP